MQTIKVLYIDINNYSVEELLDSLYIKNSEVIKLNEIKSMITKKEKAASLIFKNKYVPDYYINEYGKPVSDSVYFNISHSHGLVVFTFDDNHDIGIDIEKIRAVDNKLIDFISSEEEKQYINSESNFYEVWTNKESLMKAIGTGIRSNIKEIPALPINGVKTYLDNTYYSKTISYQDYIVTVTRKSDEPFIISVEKANI